MMKNIEYIDVQSLFKTSKKHIISNNELFKVTEITTYSEIRKNVRQHISYNIKDRQQNELQQMDVYKRHEYKSRSDYLYKLAIRYNLETEDILMFADLLGKAEDFDALPLHAEEISRMKSLQKGVRLQ